MKLKYNTLLLLAGMMISLVCNASSTSSGGGNLLQSSEDEYEKVLQYYGHLLEQPVYILDKVITDEDVFNFYKQNLAALPDEKVHDLLRTNEIKEECRQFASSPADLTKEDELQDLIKKERMLKAFVQVPGKKEVLDTYPYLTMLAMSILKCSKGCNQNIDVFTSVFNLLKLIYAEACVSNFQEAQSVSTGTTSGRCSEISFYYAYKDLYKYPFDFYASDNVDAVIKGTGTDIVNHMPVHLRTGVVFEQIMELKKELDPDQKGPEQSQRKAIEREEKDTFIALKSGLSGKLALLKKLHESMRTLEDRIELTQRKQIMKDFFKERFELHEQYEDAARSFTLQKEQQGRGQLVSGDVYAEIIQQEESFYRTSVIQDFQQSVDSLLQAVLQDRVNIAAFKDLKKKNQLNRYKVERAQFENSESRLRDILLNQEDQEQKELFQLRHIIIKNQANSKMKDRKKAERDQLCADNALKAWRQSKKEDAKHATALFLSQQRQEEQDAKIRCLIREAEIQKIREEALSGQRGYRFDPYAFRDGEGKKYVTTYFT